LEVGERKYDDPKAVKDPRPASGEAVAVRMYKDFDGNTVNSTTGVEFKVPSVG
jgi:hypothetical protein